MQKRKEYQKELLIQLDQEKYLLTNSGLPGPRSNLELLYAFIEISEPGTVLQFLYKKYPHPPANNPEEFVQCCAISALGKHILNGTLDMQGELRMYASDTRWRIRESVAMALQHIGKTSVSKLKETVAGWENGNYYEQRAIAAGLCEPAILKTDEIKTYTLDILKIITSQLENSPNNNDSSFRTLVQALCYCWSVAVVACPVYGKPFFEELLSSTNKSVLKIVRENLKKNRLIKSESAWVSQILSNVS